MTHVPPPPNTPSRQVRITWTWAFVGAWLIGIVVAGIAITDAFGHALVTSPTDWGDLVTGFVLLPAALAAVGGLLIRPQGPLVESIGFAAAGTLVFGFTFGVAIDLAPGSEACPEGCVEDAGYGAIGVMVISSLPILTGFVGGRLLRRLPVSCAGL